ncbi:TPA: DUF4231 domain-containing protein [Salmonella enterica]|nr:DUF4231 domain-containing protein [Salmonella enterica]
MLKIEFPSVYNVTNKKSARAQSLFLKLVQVEYILLIVTAVNASISYEHRYVANLYFFTALAFLLWVRSYLNFEQKWYKYRALTESIKTTTWKFAMKAEPFNTGNGINDAKHFSSYIKDIIDGGKYAIKDSVLDIVSQESMSICLKQIRELDYQARRDFYVEYRITDQRDWYANKALFNKKCGRAWSFSILSLYIMAFAISAYNAKFATQTDSMPTELITTILASLIGWVQTKKFNELSASYSLTAHEIGLIKEQAYYINSEDDFISFIRDAETAFSREHTQWLARRIA